MVLEIWFEKNGFSNLDFFSGSRKVVDQKKRRVYTIDPHFFRLEKSGSANSDFFSGLRKMVDQKKNTFLEMWMQMKWLIAFAFRGVWNLEKLVIHKHETTQLRQILQPIYPVRKISC